LGGGGGARAVQNAFCTRQTGGSTAEEDGPRGAFVVGSSPAFTWLANALSWRAEHGCASCPTLCDYLRHNKAVMPWYSLQLTLAAYFTPGSCHCFPPCRRRTVRCVVLRTAHSEREGGRATNVGNATAEAATERGQ